MIRALVALALLATPALAGPPSPGTLAVLPPSIVCDTRAQLAHIIDSYRVGQEEGDRALAAWGTLFNRLGEPFCAWSSTPPVTVGRGNDLGRVPVGDAFLHAVAVPIAGRRTTAWYLWAEPETPFHVRAGAI